MTYWLVLTLALSLVAWLAIWSRVPSKARWLTVLAVFLISPISGFVLFQSLGRPLPIIMHISSPPDGEYKVIGAKIIPGEALYVLLDFGAVPVFYTLPWDPNQASSLQKAMNEGDGTAVAEFKYSQTEDGADVVFFPPPQPPLPEKEVSESGITYEHPGT